MITPQQADDLAEKTIAQYCRAAGVETTDDVRKACEMLISKAARAIEKHSGNTAAVQVLDRTSLHIARVGGRA
ncbi:hypothetical protein [Halopseudomonas bauzanensis]|uniref:hypothetical protein n=1 Tax=Halopseudomonas bauzanensis TaxID=653930 RepID=UPI0025568CBE|nr:hypothetical protein [Halopseudomonas bauzanensis]